MGGRPKAARAGFLPSCCPGRLSRISILGDLPGHVPEMEHGRVGLRRTPLRLMPQAVSPEHLRGSVQGEVILLVALYWRYAGLGLGTTGCRWTGRAWHGCTNSREVGLSIPWRWQELALKSDLECLPSRGTIGGGCLLARDWHCGLGGKGSDVSARCCVHGARRAGSTKDTCIVDAVEETLMVKFSGARVDSSPKLDPGRNPGDGTQLFPILGGYPLLPSFTRGPRRDMFGRTDQWTHSHLSGTFSVRGSAVSGGRSVLDHHGVHGGRAGCRCAGSHCRSNGTRSPFGSERCRAEGAWPWSIDIIELAPSVCSPALRMESSWWFIRIGSLETI